MTMLGGAHAEGESEMPSPPEGFIQCLAHSSNNNFIIISAMLILKIGWNDRIPCI